jgi:hypothetical protein
MVAVLIMGGVVAVAGIALISLWHRRKPPNEMPLAPVRRPSLAVAPRSATSHPMDSGISPDQEGENWTHRELSAFLNEHEVLVAQIWSGTESNKGPASWFIDALTPRLDKLRGWLGDDTIPDLILRDNFPAVRVQKCATSADARDRAGALPGAMSWGRFLFEGQSELQAQIDAAIHGRRVLRVKPWTGKTPMEQLLGGIKVPKDQ